MCHGALGHRARQRSAHQLPARPAAGGRAGLDRNCKLAQENAGKTSAVERDLIEALSHRYANPQPEDRAPLDQAYADAMRKVWQNHPDDPDVGVLFAEAMMDLRPWDQWTPEGQPKPGTEEVLATLDAVLKLNPKHPFANHLYIHAVEASPHPERAVAAADRLRTLQPGLAHNVHMPSHIDIRTGRWQKAIETNEKAVAAADRRYRKVAGTAAGIPERLRCAQPPHARLRRDDDRPARARDEAHPRHGRRIAGRFPERERAPGRRLCRHADGSDGPLRDVG